MVTILYRPHSEHARQVTRFKEELERKGIELELVEVDSKQGAHLVSLYDTVRYPAVIVTTPDGSPLQTYSGKLPTISDVTYFARQ